MSEYEVDTPKTPTKNTTRDQRLHVQPLFFDTGWSKPQIALQLDLTLDQVKYALRHRITPQKQRTGRHPLLGPAERKQLIDWVCASKKNRRGTRSLKSLAGIVRYMQLLRHLKRRDFLDILLFKSLS
jgi:hypothetical protein